MIISLSVSSSSFINEISFSFSSFSIIPSIISDLYVIATSSIGTSFFLYICLYLSIAFVLATIERYEDSLLFSGLYLSGFNHKSIKTSATHSSISSAEPAFISIEDTIFQSNFEYFSIIPAITFSSRFLTAESIFSSLNHFSLPPRNAFYI